MNVRTLTDEDEELVERARSVIADRYEHGKHVVGAALRTESGDVYTGVNLDTNVGRAGVCAEPVVVGRAITDGASDLEAIASVRYPGPNEDTNEIEVVSPCGVCRELLSDYGPDMGVVFPQDGDVVKTDAIDLLPSKYVESYRQINVISDADG